MILQELSLLRDISIAAKQQWLKIWFTNGCFDILHPGHVYNLKEAKKYCDILIVAINSDISSYWKTKPWRPIHDQQHRAMLLDSMKYVNYVTFFDHETPILLISEILPDVLIKWGDYTPDTVVWYQEVVENGGKVIIVPIVEWYSTTNSVKKILWIS
jgi:D-beta-D-heptose 7-phosphate kinase/D-beta-D-heptose 1-phosphate adenosyltransferase